MTTINYVHHVSVTVKVFDPQAQQEVIPLIENLIRVLEKQK